MCMLVCRTFIVSQRVLKKAESADGALACRLCPVSEILYDTGQADTEVTDKYSGGILTNAPAVFEKKDNQII